MKQFIYLFVSVTLISFLGSLPLGILNITVTNLSIHQDYINALNFAAGAILVEIIIAKLSLTLIVQLEKLKILLRIFNWISFIFLFALAIYFFAAAVQSERQNISPLLKIKNLFLWGALLSLLNPLHFPFWMSWSSILKSKGLLSLDINHQFVYLLAVSFGTGLAYILYAIIGSSLIHYFKNEVALIDLIIGTSLLLTALYQLFKFFKKDKTKYKKNAQINL